jgi:putative ABC transport system permease protein
MSLALSTLIYEWRRYLAAAISLALAGVLMLALSSWLIGVMGTLTVPIDRSRAEIVVMDANSVSLGPGGGGASLPPRVMPLIYQHPDVIEVQDIPGGFGSFFGPGATEAQNVATMIIDPKPGAISLPSDFSDDMAAALAVPFNIAVDKSALTQLKVKLGDKASLNGRTVTVAVIVDGYAGMGWTNVIMSRQTQRLMGMANDERIGRLMVRIKDPTQATRVRNELNALANGQYRAWTKKELHDTIVREMTKQGPFFVAILFMSVIGAIIGVVITWQTLRGAILANIKEFASLRALGVSMGSLRRVVMELSLWVGFFGIIISGALMAGIATLAAANAVPMGFELSNLIQTGFFLLLIAIFSGAMTLGALKKGDPADLLK